MLWKRPPAEGPDARLKDIQNRFRTLRNRHDRIAGRRRFLRRYAKGGLVFFAFLVIGTLALQASPWPAGATVKHLLAFPNCDAARAVGLAPAYRGRPGYYLRHDRDRDGIACEPFWATRVSTRLHIETIGAEDKRPKTR